MTLADYFKRSDDTAAKLAERVNVSGASMSRIVKGNQNITLALARAIERETGGCVTVSELSVPKAAA